MEVNIKYSDYDNQIEKATLVLSNTHSIELQNIYEEVLPNEVAIAYLELKYIDKSDGTSISQKLNKDDIHKYRELLSLLGRQL